MKKLAGALLTLALAFTGLAVQPASAAVILDANGVPRGKLLHREELLAVYESGRPLPSTILGLTINGDDVENSGLVWDVGDIDCRAYPLDGSLVRLPWRRVPTAAVQVSMHPSEGLPASIADPRHVLLRTIEALKADGYHPVMACELEFYLLDQRRDAQGRPQPALDADGGRPRQTQVYGLRELEQIEPFLADLYSACKLHGIPARTAISEYAPGQVEITLEHRSDALQAMDKARALCAHIAARPLTGEHAVSVSCGVAGVLPGYCRATSWAVGLNCSTVRPAGRRSWFH